MKPLFTPAQVKAVCTMLRSALQMLSVEPFAGWTNPEEHRAALSPSTRATLDAWRESHYSETTQEIIDRVVSDDMTMHDLAIIKVLDSLPSDETITHKATLRAYENALRIAGADIGCKRREAVEIAASALSEIMLAKERPLGTMRAIVGGVNVAKLAQVGTVAELAQAIIERVALSDYRLTSGARDMLRDISDKGFMSKHFTA